MAKTITPTPIKGTDIISKTCDIINENFELLNTRINSVPPAADAAGYAIKEMTWDASNKKFNITFNNGTKPIKSGEISPANQNRSGLLSNLKQLIGGDKLFEDNITLNSNDSKLYGTNNKPIIQQDKNHVYIGGGKGIVIEYDDEGNFKNISIDKLSINLSENDKKTILNYVNSELESAVDELTKQTDSTVTIWQIEGLDIDSEKEVEMINSSELDKVNRPWKEDGNDTNDEDSAHIGDVLYSKASKTYYEFTKNYEWIISTDNIFGSINDQISKMQLAIDCINVDGKRNFIWATRTEMFSGTNVTKHSKGDIWVVKADENEKVAEANPYKNFTIGGLYLCESSSDDEHTGKDSTHSNSNNWKLLYDYDNYLEYQIKSDGKLYETVTNAKTAKNVIEGATDDDIISVVEKLSIINEWQKISGQKDIKDITFDNLTNDYKLGSYGDALQTAIKTVELKTDINLDTEIENLKDTFKALGEYLRDKIKIGDTPLVHTVLNDVGTNKETFLGIFNDYYTAEQNIYSKISGKAISNAYTAITDVTTIKLVVDKLTQQTDSTVTIWQIDGLNTDSSTEKDSINASEDDVKKPWTKDEDDTNDEDSAHIGDVLYSKASKTYYEFTENYEWIISTDNIFGSINDQISGMKSAIDGISVDGKINFIFASRTQMYNGDVTKHSKGDIWVVKAEEKGNKIADENPYKEFKIGGLYLCESSSDDEHTGKDSTHSNGNNWTLLTTSLSAFDVTDDVVQHGKTTIEGGLSLTNLLFVNDTDTSTTTGGLSGLKNDEVGLFLGSTYEQAYGAANWDKLDDDVKETYNYTKPNVPVLLTKSGYGSNIGGCYLDDINQKLMVPVGNIDGEITCKSLKADNDSTNPNDAEATVTSNAFKIKYGNAYIEISLVNGVPTIIGVDSSGDTSWSFGAGSNDSAMYNLIYNAIYGNVLYETKLLVSTNVYEFDSLKSKVNISLPTFTIVNKYNPALTYSDEVDGTACRIIPLKTRMKYKIGNKVKYFSYDVTQKCPYYAEVIDILCGFPIDIDKDNTNQSLMYYLYKKGITDFQEYIKNKYGINIEETDLINDIGNTDKSYVNDTEKYIDKHDMTYSQYYIEYIKFAHLSEYNCAIYKAYHNSVIDGQDATLVDYTYNYVSAGENKIMNFHDDFKGISAPTKYTYFYNNFTTKSGESTYEVKILNQDGEWRNIIAGNNTDGDLPYDDSTNKPSYVITDADADWDTYKKEYIKNNSNGITADNFDSKKYKYLFVFDKQDGLPTPRNLSELAFNSWWYSLNSIVYKANNDDYNEEYDDFYPRIFDVTCEIELFDTGAGGEHTNTMTHIDKVSKYNYERLFNVYKNSTEASEKESKKKYTNLKLVYANYNVTNVLQYNETEAYIEYRLSITESISGDVYTITHTSKDTLYLLNGEKISGLPAELSEFFNDKNMTVTFTLDKTRGNTANVSIFDKSSGKITFSGENSSDFKEDVLYIDMKVTPPTKDKLNNIDESKGTIDFDTATTSIELPNTISVTRLYEGENYSSIYQKHNMMITDPAIDPTTSDDTTN